MPRPGHQRVRGLYRGQEQTRGRYLLSQLHKAAAGPGGQPAADPGADPERGRLVPPRTEHQSRHGSRVRRDQQSRAERHNAIDATHLEEEGSQFLRDKKFV